MMHTFMHTLHKMHTLWTPVHRLCATLGIAVLLSMPLFAVAVDEKPLADPALEQKARSLMKEIRCLVCQNQSIEDSNAELAQDLRQIVREHIGAGESPEDVRTYLVARYGDWVLLEPPFKSSTYFLWASPFVFLLLVGAGIVATRKKSQPASPLSAQEEEKLRALLEDEEEKKL